MRGGAALYAHKGTRPGTRETVAARTPRGARGLRRSQPAAAALPDSGPESRGPSVGFVTVPGEARTAPRPAFQEGPGWLPQ